MDLFSGEITMPAEKLMELLAEAFIEGVAQGPQRATSHPLLCGDEQAASEWALGLMGRVFGEENIWIHRSK